MVVLAIQNPGSHANGVTIKFIHGVPANEQDITSNRVNHPRANGGYSKGVPPLTIPNREVKPFHADGTAFTGGRVGSRLPKQQWPVV